MPDRIEKAKRISPNIDFLCGNAEKLPYEDNSFDIVLCFTVFTSILDENMKLNIANEILRVQKLSGVIFWYDYWISKPTNPDVKGVSKKEIKKLFPGCEIHLKRITLVPPLTRALIKFSWILCFLLKKLKILNTHYLAVIKRVR